MKLEINDSYIAWIRLHTDDPLDGQALTEYINEVLASHRQSWEELDESIELGEQWTTNKKSETSGQPVKN